MVEGVGLGIGLEIKVLALYEQDEGSAEGRRPTASTPFIRGDKTSSLFKHTTFVKRHRCSRSQWWTMAAGRCAIVVLR